MMFNDTAILFPFGLFKGKFNPFLPPTTVNPLDHVADANARLSIDPTGKVAGYQVIQDDNGLTYTFNGDGADADAGLIVDAVPFSSRGMNEGKNFYNVVGQGDDPAVFAITNDGDAWNKLGEFGGVIDASSDNPDYPWQATWGSAVVTRNPIASLNNWTP